MQSFCEILRDKAYSRTKFNNNFVEFKNMLHPVGIKITKEFSPNDFKIKESNFKVLTGPNMAGKSTYMKEIALNIILAQTVGLICAKYGKTYIFDRIYAGTNNEDELNKGNSTFMSEMLYVNKILKYATDKTLILFDELGKGTSTYDGVKLAYSISSYLIEKNKSAVIFATHFHKLSSIQTKYPEKVENLMIGENFDIEKNVDTLVELYLKLIPKEGKRIL